MAKSRPIENEEIIPPDAGLPGLPQGGTGKSSPPDDGVDHAKAVTEIDRLKAEIAARDLALAEAHSALQERGQEIARLTAPAAAPDLSGPPKRFLVEVENGPTWVVACPHESMAAGEYLATTGMRAFGYPPKVTEVPADMPLGRRV